VPTATPAATTDDATDDAIQADEPAKSGDAEETAAQQQLDQDAISPWLISGLLLALLAGLGGWYFLFYRRRKGEEA
jgi:hypothetical protein